MKRAMLCIAVGLVAYIIGVYVERHYAPIRENVVVKNIATTSHEVSYEGYAVKADMTFLWVDTHSQRLDFVDDSVGMRMKLYGALVEAVKHCEAKGITERGVYFYTCVVKYFYETEGPFNEGRDWVSFEIISITFPIEDGQSITVGMEHGIMINPYYKGNYYFENCYIPRL